MCSLVNVEASPRVGALISYTSVLMHVYLEYSVFAPKSFQGN